jgi:hypothetical protein
VESNLDEISGGKLGLQLKQPAVDGNGLEFCARPPTAFGRYCSRNRSVELYPG